MKGCKIEVEMAYAAMKPLLSMLGDYRGLNLSVIKRLSSLVQLFPHTFNEKLCDSLQVLCQAIEKYFRCKVNEIL